MAAGMKSLAKDTAIYGISSIGGRLLNWLLVPFYTRVLFPGEYGIAINIYAMTALLLVVLTYGMETGFFRFINHKDEQQPMRVYATTLYSVAFTSILFIFGCLFFLNPLSNVLRYGAHPEYISLMACVVAVDAFCCIPFAYLRYQRKAIRFVALKSINICLNIFLNVFFLLLCPLLHDIQPELIRWFYRPDYGVGYIFVANAFTTAITLILLMPEILPCLREKIDLQLLKRIFNYSFPILILGIAGIFNQNADKILFPFLFEDKVYADAQLGIYGACCKITVIIIMFIQAFRYAYEPFIFAKNKDSGDKKTYVDAMKYFIIFSCIIFTGVVFYLDILKYIIDAKYFSGLIVVPIVMLGEILFGIYYNLSVWYKVTDQTRWGAYFSIIGCVLTVAMIVGFVPRYGFIACAWAIFTSNLVMMLMSYFVGQRKFPVVYNLRSARFYACLTAFFCAVAMFPAIDSIFLRLTYRTIILLIFIVIIIKKDLPLSEIPVIGKYFKAK